VGVAREDYDWRTVVLAFALVPLHCSLHTHTLYHQCSEDPASGAVAQEKGMAGAEEARSLTQILNNQCPSKSIK